MNDGVDMTLDEALACLRDYHADSLTDADGDPQPAFISSFDGENFQLHLGSMDALEETFYRQEQYRLVLRRLRFLGEHRFHMWADECPDGVTCLNPGIDNPIEEPEWKDLDHALDMAEGVTV